MFGFATLHAVIVPATQTRHEAAAWFAPVLVSGVLMIWLLLSIWLVVRGDHGREDDGDDFRDGGGGPRVPDPPCPRRGGEPDWWPEFERKFADYVNRPDTPRVSKARERALASVTDLAEPARRPAEPSAGSPHLHQCQLDLELRLGVVSTSTVITDSSATGVVAPRGGPRAREQEIARSGWRLTLAQPKRPAVATAAGRFGPRLITRCG